MRHATAILIGALCAPVPPGAAQEAVPTPSPSPAASPATALSAAAPDAKVAGRDVPAPKRVRFVSPVFPPAAQAAGQRGIVILELLIDETGKIAAADVVRSVAPFDEAALTAVRQWEYEITKVDGRPVPVRLTVPITFALKLPEMTRASGIPELRQGASPAFPAGTREASRVVADVTLLPDGTVAEAAIREGDSPYAEAILQTLRTWRFAADAEGPPITFQVSADFVPGPPARIDLRLSNLRTGERRAAAAPEETPDETASAAPPSGANPPTTPPADDVAASTPTTAPPSTTAPATSVPPATPAPPSTPSTTTPSAPTTPTATPPPTPAATTPTPAPPIPNPPVAPPPRPEGVRPSPVAPTPPPVEVIPGGVPGAGRSVPGTPPPASAPAVPGQAPPPGLGVPAVAPSPVPTAPPEPGVSAVRDVALGPGVPDLTKGRRPVAPPLARMSAVSGSVEIQFSVDAAGSSSVQQVAGHELLKEAARQAVASWSFRRTSAERVYLVATFTYEGDKAQAEVKRAE
jgi:TonB family protein